MKKKLLSILLTICMLLTLLPGPALATGEPPTAGTSPTELTVLGQDILSSGKITGVGYEATYEALTNTLTLTGVFSATELVGDRFVYAGGDLNLVLDGCTIDAGKGVSTAWFGGVLALRLVGENTIRSDFGISTDFGISISAAPGGSLDIAVETDSALSSDGFLAVESGVTLTAQGGSGSSALSAKEEITFDGAPYTGKARRVEYEGGALHTSTPLTTLSIRGTEYLASGKPLPANMTFDAQSSTLTLTDIESKEGSWTIHADGDLNLVLTGCTIHDRSIHAVTVEVGGALNLVLDTSTLINGSRNPAFQVHDTLNLTLMGENTIIGNPGLHVTGDITLSAEGNGALSGDIYSEFGDIHLRSGLLDVSSSLPALEAPRGSIAVDNAVTLTAVNDTASPAVAAGKEITFGGVPYTGSHPIILYKEGNLVAIDRPTRLAILGTEYLSGGTPEDLPEGATYNQRTATLTLTSDFTVPGDTVVDFVIASDGDLHLVLDGEIAMEGQSLGAAVMVSGNLYVTGDGGQLTTNAPIGLGVDSGSLHVTNLHLVMTGATEHIMGCFGSAWLTGCTVEAPGGQLWADDLTIDGGSFSLGSGSLGSSDIPTERLTLTGGANVQAATLEGAVGGSQLLVEDGSVLALTDAPTLEENATLTVEQGASLVLKGPAASLEGGGTVEGDGSFTIRCDLQETDIAAISDQVYTGSAIAPTVTVNSRTLLGKAFTVDIQDYLQTYEGSTLNAGTGYVVFTPKEGIAAETVRKPFTIVPSTTAFEGGVKVYNDGRETTQFTYGDTITVQVTPVATGEAAPARRSFGEPQGGQMALYQGETQISEASSAGEGGVYTMTIHTRDKALGLGSNTITARYVASDNLADAAALLEISLAPKAIAAASVSTGHPSATRGFNGSTAFDGVALTLDGIGTDDVSATANGVAAGTAVGTHGFTATSVALRGAHVRYYDGLTPGAVSGQVTIAKALATVAAPAPIPMAQSVARTYRFDLFAIALPANAGAKVYTLGTVEDSQSLLGDCTLENGILTVQATGIGNVDDTATVTVTIASDSYQDIDIPLTLLVSAKTPVDISGVTVAGQVYNGQRAAMTGTPVAKDGDNPVNPGAFRYTWSTAAGGPLEDAPKDAGDYKLTVSVAPDHETYTGAQELPFSIGRAAITIQADNKAAYVDDEAPTPTYTVTGLAKDEALSSNPTAEYAFTPDMTEPGETAITVSGGAVPASGNYDAIITYMAGKLIVSNRPAPSGGGGGGSTTETEKHPDGSTTTTVTDQQTGTVTETTKHPDGTTQVVQTQKDGTVIQQRTTADGTKAELVKKPDGSMTSVEERPDGTKAQSSTTADGKTTATVTVPRDKARVTVTIPTVRQPAPGQVAMILHADGTREVVKTSVATEDGLRIILTGDATLELVDNAKDFGDVAQDSWYADSVAFASSRELFQGTGDGSFSPEATMTRSMLMTVLYRFSDADVSSGGAQWYSDALAWSVEAGLSDGKKPQADISREQLATILHRFAGTPEAQGAALGSFADDNSISPWAADALTWAVERGILQGDGTALHPQETATRAEVATMLQRFVSLEDGQ